MALARRAVLQGTTDPTARTEVQADQKIAEFVANDPRMEALVHEILTSLVREGVACATRELQNFRALKEVPAEGKTLAEVFEAEEASQ